MLFNELKLINTPKSHGGQTNPLFSDPITKYNVVFPINTNFRDKYNAYIECIIQDFNVTICAWFIDSSKLVWPSVNALNDYNELWEDDDHTEDCMSIY